MARVGAADAHHRPVGQLRPQSGAQAAHHWHFMLVSR
jgi:hypothetical protein